MKKRTIFIILIIILLVIAGFFIIKKINDNKRKYEIEKISDFKYFVLKDKENYGVIDATGKTIIEAKYESVEIPNPSKDVFICYKKEKGIAMNANNKQLFAEYNSVEAIDLKNVATNLAYEKSVLKTEKNGKYGLININGKQILDTEYDSIEGLDGIEGELKIQKNGKLGVASIKGTILVDTEYDTVSGDNYYDEERQHGYIVGNKNENGYNYGYINSNGKLITKIEYNDISRVTDIPAKEGIYLIASKNGQYGVIKNKKNIINNEYQSIEYEKEKKVYILQKGQNYGVANYSGKIIIPIENTNIQAKGQFLYVEKNNIREVYDENGNNANIDFNKTIENTQNENYKIIIDSQENVNYYGVINKDNKQIIKSEYLYIEYAYGNYFIACGTNGKLGVVDSNSKEVAELKYDLVQKIQGKDLIQTLLTETNTTEIYSKDMKKICEMQNAIVENVNDCIKISSNEDVKYINSNGELVSSSKALPNNKLFADCKNGKWGFVDASGKIVVSYDYELAYEFNQYGYASVKKDGKWGAIDTNGKVVAEPTHQINETYGRVEFISEYVKVDNGFGDVYYTKDI